jgi:hypothetical protein
LSIDILNNAFGLLDSVDDVRSGRCRKPASDLLDVLQAD